MGHHIENGTLFIDAGEPYLEHDGAPEEDEETKKKKRVAKHSDDTNAVYTEGTKLVINSKWG